MSGFTHPQTNWDKRFSTPDYLFGEEPKDFLVSQASRLGQGHALALAHGEGRNSVWLAQQGFTVDAFVRRHTDARSFCGLRCMGLQHLETPFQEGTGHSSMSALVGFLSSKP
jgi:hypothetical protein